MNRLSTVFIMGFAVLWPAPAQNGPDRSTATRTDGPMQAAKSESAPEAQPTRRLEFKAMLAQFREERAPAARVTHRDADDRGAASGASIPPSVRSLRLLIKSQRIREPHDTTTRTPSDQEGLKQ